MALAFRSLKPAIRRDDIETLAPGVTFHIMNLDFAKDWLKADPLLFLDYVIDRQHSLWVGERHYILAGTAGKGRIGGAPIVAGGEMWCPDRKTLHFNLCSGTYRTKDRLYVDCGSIWVKAKSVAAIETEGEIMERPLDQFTERIKGILVEQFWKSEVVVYVDQPAIKLGLHAPS